MTSARIAISVLMFGCLAAAGCGADPEVAKWDYVRSGDGYAASNRYPEAVIEYRNALKHDPMFGDARLKLADAYEKLGDVRNALAEYQRGADLLPGDAGVQVRAANLLLVAGRFEAAQARAEKALALAPTHVEAQIAKGNALAGLKNLDAAVTHIEAAIRESPDRSASHAILGALEVARGNRDLAEAAFRKATETDPGSVTARLALANLYWGTGSLPAAERELKAARALGPNDILANRTLAVFYLATDRASAAEPYLKFVVDASRQNSDGSVLAFVLADYYASTGRPAEAKSLLNELAKADALSFAAATIRLSAIAARGGDTTGARQLIDAVLQEQPGNVDALVARANLFLGDKEDDQALVPAAEAVKLNPRSASAHYALARVHSARQEWDDAIGAYREVLKLDPRVNAARLEIARISLVRGNPDTAIQFAQDALVAQPGLAEATTILSRAMLTKGYTRSAAPHVTQLAKAFPQSASAQAGLGQFHAQKGDRTQARRAFEQALTIDSENIEALSGLTALDLDAKNPAAARARLDARLAANRSDPQLLLLGARLYMAIGDLPATERSLRKAIDADPAQLDAYALLGQFYASQRRLDEARAEFEKIAQRRSEKNAVGAETVIAMILQMQNKHAEARGRYERVLSMDPRAAVAANNLAWIYAEGGGDLDAALRLAQTAKAQLADSPEVSDTLGWVYYKKGLPDAAVASFRESVEQSPKNAVYRYHLGLAYEKSGNNEAARTALEQALALDPKFDGSADARRLLTGIKELLEGGNEGHLAPVPGPGRSGEGDDAAPSSLRAPSVERT